MKIMRILALVAILAALGYGWHALWNRSADRIEDTADSFLSDLSRSGHEVVCANRRIEGFPFRIGLLCDSLTVYAADGGGRFEGGAFRSAAQFYDPTRIVVEFDGPVLGESPGNVPTRIDWQSLRASARYGADGFRAVSIEGTDLAASDGWATDAAPFAAAQDLEIHARISPDSEDDIDLAVSAAGLLPAGALIGPLAISADLRLAALAQHLLPGLDPIEHIRAHGLAGKANELTLRPESGGELIAFGEFTISRTGLLSADLVIDADNISALIAYFEDLFPRERETLATVQAVLSTFTTSGGKVSGLLLKIDDGTVRIGPFEVARIAPLI